MRRLLLVATAVSLLSFPLYGALDKPAPFGGASVREMDLFVRVFERVRADYVQPVTDEKLVESAINGMLTALDPHSGYMNEQELREMEVQTQGEFGGIGAEITQENGQVKVVTPIDDTPAARAGLKPGDIIARIDDQTLSDMTLTEVVDRLRGQPDTEVKLTVRREGKQPFDVSVTRAIVKVQSVKSHLEPDNIAYVRITSFTEQTEQGLKEAVEKLKRQSGGTLGGLVLDLRNNPGGLLEQAVSVAGSFLNGGEIVSTRGRQPEDNQSFTAKPNGDLLHGVPVVVLINGGSASASEIVAGALQDHHRAVLLGTKSFGKGSVQTIIPLPGHGAMRLTTARYYTPSGRSIQAKGIEPDIVVEPAKIERIAQGQTIHEADLRHALKNPDQSAAAPGQAPPPNVPAGTKPAAPSDHSEADGLDAGLLGTPEDYQLARAVDLLRGVRIYSSLAGQKS
jgi:carboxyl-terminal processing protease